MEEEHPRTTRTIKWPARRRILRPSQPDDRVTLFKSRVSDLGLNVEECQALTAHPVEERRRAANDDLDLLTTFTAAIEGPGPQTRSDVTPAIDQSASSDPIHRGTEWLHRI